jgi:hypothetical protein
MPIKLKTKKQKGKEFIFHWSKVPGKDSIRLLKYLSKEFKYVLPDSSTVEKIDNGETIIIYHLTGNVILRLNSGRDIVAVSRNGVYLFSLSVHEKKGDLKIKGKRDSRYRKILDIEDAPLPTEIPTEFQRGGAWFRFVDDTLEIYSSEKTLIYTLSIDEEIDEKYFQEILPIIRKASERYDDIKTRLSEQNDPWSGNETIEF